MANPNIVTLTECAKILGYSRKSLENWIAKEGAPVIAKPGKGKATQIDTVAMIQWLIDRNQFSEDDPDEYKRAMLGKLQEEERKLAIANAEKLGQLVPAEDVDAVFSETLVLFRSALEGAAGRVAGGNKVLRTRLLNEFRRILESAEDRLGEYLETTASEVETSKAAA